MLGLLYSRLEESVPLRRRPSSWRGVCRRQNARKMRSPLKLVWTTCLIGAVGILLAGCVTTAFSAVSASAGAASAYFDYKTSEASEPIVVTPDLPSYSANVQDKAADELEKLSQPCPRDNVISDCSAVARFVLDYGRMREQIRSAKKED